MTNKILFVVSAKTPTGVIASQVLTLAEQVKSRSERDVVVWLIGRKEPSHLFSTVNVTLEYKENLSCLLKVKRSKIYFRGYDLFLKGFLLLLGRKNTTLYDFRALVYLESFFRYKSIARKSVLFFMELLVYLLADNLTCVSNNLKDTLISAFKVRRQIFVYPCLNSHTTILKKEVDLKTKRVFRFVYVGGMAEWQRVEEIIFIYERLRKDLEGTLTIITNEIARAKEICAVSKESIEIKSLSHKEVLMDLPNYDFGFLLRDCDIINRVASPIKFLEYIFSYFFEILICHR